jgi:hypothetical protein
METIPIWVSEIETVSEGTKAVFSSQADAVLRNVSVKAFQDNLGALCRVVGQSLSESHDIGNGFRLREITLEIEVSAEGSVSLIGSAKLGGKGAITLHFDRPK